MTMYDHNNCSEDHVDYDGGYRESSGSGDIIGSDSGNYE